MLETKDAYSEVLLLAVEPSEGKEEEPQVQVATPSPVLDAAIVKTADKHIEGNAPPHFLEQSLYSSHASSSLCLDKQEQYARLTHYMNSRGGYD